MRYTFNSKPNPARSGGREIPVECEVDDHDEPDTMAWFALRMGRGCSAYLDAFAHKRGRDAHLQGKLAKQITSKADLFVKMPEMQRVEVLADKLPH